ncbi:hypothetical protein M0805_000880 [Coniferiporia weirii]|nr:hypothetical protein M0805_000880 [Coniferiporia weirii]
MNKMDTDDLPVVLPSTTASSLSLSLHPLPILNISEHLTRIRLQKNINTPFVIGGLLGTQNGREVDIVNTFELAMDSDNQEKLNEAFLISRKEQYKQVFPSLELIGWYTVTQEPTALHVALHEQFVPYTANPILLAFQPNGSSKSDGGQALPLKAYEPTVEIRDRSLRNVFVEASYSVETGEAERIAVDWTAKGGEGGTSLDSHLQTQRAAVKMLHDRIQLLVQYVAGVVSGTAPKDYAALRSLTALVASLPASEHPEFREEFDKEYEDVQLTAFLSALTNSANILNELVDKHIVVNAGSGRDDRIPGGMMMKRRGMGGRSGPMGIGMVGDWDRFH